MKYRVILLTCITIGISGESKIGGVTYFDYTNAEESSAFNFNRQYFSYAVDAEDGIKFKVIFDVGRTSEDTRLVAFLKKAQIDNKTSYGKISMGLIGTNTYGIQEKNWGYRFIEKSAIDKNGFSSTADLGIGFSRNLIDNLNMSLQLTNGEGYKQSQGDKFHKISFNTTYGERNLNQNDGYNVGVVYSTESSDGDPTNMISIFGGISGSRLGVVTEYNILQNRSLETNIISLSANYDLRDKMDVFIRYDIFDDNKDDTVEKNGNNYLIAGVQFKCGNGLSVAPNMRMTSFEDGSDAVTEYKINFQFKF